MLDCRNCKVEDCDCKTDLLKALELIDNYASRNLVVEIEELLQNGLEECEDYESEE